MKEGLKKEVDERNFTISQKENRILEIKQKNQELEKYRFVLDYKIGELKQELSKHCLIDFKSKSKSNPNLILILILILIYDRSKRSDDQRHENSNQSNG